MGQSLPAMLTLFMLINTGIYGAVFLTQERQDRVLARLATFPLSRRSILAGKLLGRTLMALLQAAILLLAGRFLLGAYLGGSLLALALVVLCLSLAVAAIALFWGAVLRRVNQATSVTLTVSLFLGAIGGCWWPLEVVPGWMRSAGHISPAAWAMDGFHAVISFGAGTAAVVVPCLMLLAYATLFTLVGARMLRWTP
jgi:ABC-2 type transport system permease protein